MIEFTPERPEPATRAGSSFHLEAHALARLESLAKTKGISTTDALHLLLEAGTRHLTLGETQPIHALSKKQVIVLESLQAGHSVKEIAAQLGVLEGTVRTHIRRIRSHLNRTDLLSLRYQ
jgi:DNA-binding NarL/FixJ family response regulator